MHAFAQPLASLQVEVTRFLRRPALRLLHVVAMQDLHEAVVALLLAQELRLDNRRPFVIFEQAHRRSDPGWSRRSRAAREQHAWRRDRMAGCGEALGALPPAPASTGLQAFAEQLGQLLVMRPEQTEDLVVLLAPASIENERAWQDALVTLLSLDGLAGVRWIVVDRGSDTLPPGLAKIEAEVLRVCCETDGASPKAPVAETFTGFLSDGAGFIRAHPRGITPPRRVDDPPPAPPDPTAESRRALRRDVLLASDAMNDGRTVEAVRHQRVALDRAGAAGLDDERLTMALMLGATLLAAGASKEAQATYREAIRSAEVTGQPDKGVIAHLALGATLLAGGDHAQALIVYAEGSALAERTGPPLLALEACRLTGDLAHELHMDLQAIACWSRAVTLGGQIPTTASLTGAGLAALSLARLCQERGQVGPAKVFLDKAHALTAVDPARLEVEARAEGGDAPRVDADPPPLPASVPRLPPSETTTRLVPGPVATIAADAPKDLATERLTLDDLAWLHGWRDAGSQSVIPPTQRLEILHHWSGSEQAALRGATSQLLSQETTALLSAGELKALRGDAGLPDARVRSDVARTLRLDISTLQGPAGRPDAPMASTGPRPPRAGLPSPRLKPETERTVRVSADELRALRELLRPTPHKDAD